MLWTRNWCYGGRVAMSWYVVVLSLAVGGLAWSAGYGLQKARLRRQATVARLRMAWPRPHPSWGMDMECGIEAVNSQGEVIGIVVVPAPALNGAGAAGAGDGRHFRPCRFTFGVVPLPAAFCWRPFAGRGHRSDPDLSWAHPVWSAAPSERRSGDELFSFLRRPERFRGPSLGLSLKARARPLMEANGIRAAWRGRAEPDLSGPARSQVNGSVVRAGSREPVTLVTGR